MYLYQDPNKAHTLVNMSQVLSRVAFMFNFLLTTDFLKKLGYLTVEFARVWRFVF